MTGVRFIGDHFAESFLIDGPDVTALNDLESYYVEGGKGRTLEIHREVADEGGAEYRFIEEDVQELGRARDTVVEVM